MLANTVFSLLLSISNPGAPSDVYVIDHDLTLEDCGRAIVAGVEFATLDDGTRRYIGESDYALTCERDDSPVADQSGIPEIISTGPRTFKTSWGESSIRGAESHEEKPAKRKRRKK